MKLISILFSQSINNRQKRLVEIESKITNNLCIHKLLMEVVE